MESCEPPRVESIAKNLPSGDQAGYQDDEPSFCPFEILTSVPCLSSQMSLRVNKGSALKTLPSFQLRSIDSVTVSLSGAKKQSFSTFILKRSSTVRPLVTPFWPKTIETLNRMVEIIEMTLSAFTRSSSFGCV